MPPRMPPKRLILMGVRSRRCSSGTRCAMDPPSAAGTSRRARRPPHERDRSRLGAGAALGGGWVQGYNAQAAAVAGGIVVAADVTANPADTTMLEPMVGRIGAAVTAATGQSAGVVVADAGYWVTDVIEDIEADDGCPTCSSPPAPRPEQQPEPLPEPDLTDYHAAVAAHDAAVAAERARRVAVIARVVNGELLLREAAELLDLSVPHIGGIKLAWQAGAARPRREPATDGRRRPQPPTGPTRAARSRHAMDTRLAKPAGRSLYRQRKRSSNPSSETSKPTGASPDSCARPRRSPSRMALVSATYDTTGTPIELPEEEVPRAAALAPSLSSFPLPPLHPLLSALEPPSSPPSPSLPLPTARPRCSAATATVRHRLPDPAITAGGPVHRRRARHLLSFLAWYLLGIPMGPGYPTKL